jgi:hypothetical protein
MKANLQDFKMSVLAENLEILQLKHLNTYTPTEARQVAKIQPNTVSWGRAVGPLQGPGRGPAMVMGSHLVWNLYKIFKFNWPMEPVLSWHPPLLGQEGTGATHGFCIQRLSAFLFVSLLFTILCVFFKESLSQFLKPSRLYQASRPRRHQATSSWPSKRGSFNYLLIAVVRCEQTTLCGQRSADKSGTQIFMARLLVSKCW